MCLGSVSSSYWREDVGEAAVDTWAGVSTIAVPSGSGSTSNAANTFWNDFLTSDLDPRSICCLPGVWQHVNAFDSFGNGVSYFEKEEHREMIFDRCVIHRMRRISF